MKRPLSILQISANYPPKICGIGDYTFELTHALKNLGVRVENWSSVDSEFRSAKWNAVETLRAFRKIDFDRFDILHLQYEPYSFTQSYILPFLLAHTKRPLAVTFHEVFQRHLLQRMRDRRLATLAAALIVNDAGTEKRLAALLQGRHRPIYQVGVGSNIPSPGLNVAIERRDTTKSAIFRLGYFGFLNAVKRVDLLIEALGLLHRQGHTNVRLRLIGDFQSSPRERLVLEEQARALSVETSIEWCVGFSGADVAGKISECDLMILPFLDGATPRRGSFQACLALGKAVVTTRPKAEDTEIQLANHVAVLENLDAASIASKVIELIRDPIAISRLEEASKLLGAKFAWPLIAVKHLKIYESLIFKT